MSAIRTSYKLLLLSESLFLKHLESDYVGANDEASAALLRMQFPIILAIFGKCAEYLN